MMKSVNTNSCVKVILDTDMVMLFDDGIAMMMLANHPDVELLGVTVVSGNTWVAEGIAYTIRQLETIGRFDIPVAMGIHSPFRSGRREGIELERKMFGYTSDFAGCFSSDAPESWQGVYRAEFDSEPKIEPVEKGAVDFLIDTIKANPGEVVVMPIGPCMNLAAAVRIAPEIVPMIKSVVYMGGAFDVPGNITPAAEFNFWFDPEAARMCVRTPFKEQVFVGLDVCDKYCFNRDIYDRIIALNNPVARMLKEEFGPRFEKDPKYTRFVWDTIVAAIVIDPTLITEEEMRWIDVNDQYGLDYGRSLGFKKHGPAGTQKGRILMSIDEERFWDLMVELLGK